jgi:hypothetical protein
MVKPSGMKSARTPSPATPSGVARSRAKKVSLTVDEGVLRAMKLEAKRTGRALSAEVNDALARELRRRRLSELIAEYESEHGTIGADELARIQAEWQG